MRRLVLMGLGVILVGFLIPITSAGAASHPTYALGSAKKCKAHYVEKIEKHKVKGKTVSYIACVYKAPKVAKTVSAPTPPPLPTTTTTTVPGPSPLGTTFTVKDSSGDDVEVLAISVLDPAPPATTFDTAPSGQQLIGVEIEVVNEASSPFTDDMDDDVTIVGSDAQTYTASFNDIEGCTNFDFGTVDLTTEASAVGCVSFNLPDGVNPAQVEFTIDAGFGGPPVKWEA